VYARARYYYYYYYYTYTYRVYVYVCRVCTYAPPKSAVTYKNHREYISNMPVARTTVTIHAETHERLKDENQETESMDETINRLLDK